MKIFKDRKSAGLLLAGKLKGVQADLVLAVPRGGVVVGKEIADKLNLPLDIIITRKIGAPRQSELALGAIDPDGEVVWDDEVNNGFYITEKEVEETVERELQEIKRRESLYRKGKLPLNLEEKIVILVDDGIATGSTILSAILYIIRHDVKKIILVSPVASRESLEKIGHEVDQKVILEIPEQLLSVGQFYKDFKPVTDQEVVSLLRYGK